MAAANRAWKLSFKGFGPDWSRSSAIAPGIANLPHGHRGRQEIAVRQTEATRAIRGLEVSRVPGLFQTPEYARAIFDANAEFRGITPTTEAAVEARMRRQEALYDPAKTFRFLVCEAALYHRSCPVDVMAEQLDRLYNLVGQRRIELGILPFGTQLRRTAPHAFWIYDRRLVIVETISEELWLTVEDDIQLYERAWDWLAESAEFGTAGTPPDRPSAGLSNPSLGNRRQAPGPNRQSRAIEAQVRNCAG